MLKLIFKIIIILSLVIQFLYGQWSNDTTKNTPVCIKPNSQFNLKIIEDGENGAIISWFDAPQTERHHIYISHLDFAGKNSWNIENGEKITYTEGPKFSQAMTNDCFGGAIIVWEESYQIYSQKINKIGVIQWDTIGVKLAESLSSNNKQNEPFLICDSENNTYITWWEEGDTNAIRLKAIPNEEKPVLGLNEKTIIKSKGVKKSVIAGADSGDVFVSWVDFNYNIYLTYISLFKQERSWDTTLALTKSRTIETLPILNKNASNGLFVVWEDKEFSYQVTFFQKVNKVGTLLYDSTAMRICPFQSNQTSPFMIDDGQNGIYVVWEDGRSGIKNIYAQRIDGEGNRLWELNGKVICETEIHSTHPIAVRDGKEGLIITWQEGNKILAQRLDKDGNELWKNNGITITSSQAKNINYLNTITNNDGGAIIAWSDDRNSNFDIFAQIALDKTPPRIKHTPVGIIGEGMPINLNIEIEDSLSIIKQFSSSYRVGGEIKSTSIILTETEKNIYNAVIPAGAVTSKGLQYFIYSKDLIDNDITAGPFLVNIQINNLLKSTSQPANIYQLISFPLNPVDLKIENILKDDLGNYDNTKWRLFKWDSFLKNYIELTDPDFNDYELGRGYWLITGETKTISVGPGIPVNINQNFLVQFEKDWNIISNPFNFSVSWDNVNKSNGLMNVWDYNGEGYVKATKLEPWKSYFIYGWDNSNYIEIPTVATNSTLNRRNISSSESKEIIWKLNLKASAGNYNDFENFFGVARDADLEWDGYDDIEPPIPPGAYISLSFPNLKWKKYANYYASDFQPQSDNAFSWDFIVKANIPYTQIELSLGEINNFPKNYKIILTDKIYNAAQKIDTNSKYHFLSAGKETQREFNIKVIPDDLLEKENVLELIPDNFDLLNNFPNPFNSATEIHYSISSPDYVSIKIYNIHGKEIKNLVEHEYHESGFYNAIWQGDDYSLERVSSGVYFCELSIIGLKIKLNKKMMLIK